MCSSALPKPLEYELDKARIPPKILWRGFGARVPSAEGIAALVRPSALTDAAFKQAKRRFFGSIRCFTSKPNADSLGQSVVSPHTA